jgi:acyl-CoA dehydrogenase
VSVTAGPTLPGKEEILNDLKAIARDMGLWNFFLPESQGGAGISNLEYAHLAEIMGRSRLASEAFNCSAPDTGNMEVLERYGSEGAKTGSGWCRCWLVKFAQRLR